MHNDVFKLYSEIIEITEKPDTPTGELGESGIGNTYVMDDADLGSDFFTRDSRYWTIGYATTIY
jgi:hypothetical protein